MTKTFEEYKAEAKKQTDSSRNRDITTIDNSADALVKLANDTYNQSVDDTEADYASQYERNAVQKLINEKQVAERMANLGLTDSGLNRTQQTAVQLSYANQKGKIDLAKQQALDKLSSDLASYVTGINNQREADKLSVNQFYDQQNDTIATEMYNTDVNAGVELQKAAIEASAKAKENENNKILWYYTGTYDEDDNPIFRNSEGKTQAFGAGVNPYTGTKHKDVKYGTFSNGYQPNNIDDEPLTPARDKNGGIVYVNITGKKQTLWMCGNRYYIWYGDENIYKEADVSELDLE